MATILTNVAASENVILMRTLFTASSPFNAFIEATKFDAVAILVRYTPSSEREVVLTPKPEILTK